MKAILESVGRNFSQSFYCGNYQHDTFNDAWHYHPYWEVTYIESGEGIAYIGNTIRQFTKGDFVLLPPNIPHCWRSEPIKNTLSKSTFVQWNEKLLGDDWLNIPEFSNIKRMLSFDQSGVVFPEKENITTIEALKELPSYSGFDKLWKLISILQNLSLSKYSLINASTTFRSDPTITKRVSNIMQYVEKNFHTKISAKQLSAVSHLTQTSFSKFFKKNFNKTFSTFLNEYRIQQACRLLLSTNYAIEEVAYQCGYNNLALFHRQFKKITAYTFNKYRFQYNNI